jgi:hypothetical protein
VRTAALRRSRLGECTSGKPGDGGAVEAGGSTRKQRRGGRASPDQSESAPCSCATQTEAAPAAPARSQMCETERPDVGGDGVPGPRVARAPNVAAAPSTHPWHGSENGESARSTCAALAAPVPGSTQCQVCPAAAASSPRPAESLSSKVANSTSSTCCRADLAIRASRSIPDAGKERRRFTSCERLIAAGGLRTRRPAAITCSCGWLTCPSRR